MKKHVLLVLAMIVTPFSAFAVDGTVLINQSTVTAMGGFPYTITQSGSYKLSGNLVVPSGLSGIVITVPNVTIDLNGFNIASLGFTSIFTNYAIGATGTGLYNIIVRNGTLTDWTQGIVFFSNVSLVTVQDLNVLETFNIGGTSISNGIAVNVPVHSIVKRVLTDGQVHVACPSIVSETIANIQQSGGGCVLSVNAVP